MRVIMAGADDSLAPVYKIFSKTELDKDELSQLFRDIKFTHVKPWLAYPEYTTNDDFSHFQLAPGQFYYQELSSTDIVKLKVQVKLTLVGPAAARLCQMKNI